MKLALKIICVFLIFALLTSCEAATENKDMPIKKEVTYFIDNFEAPESGDFVNSIYNAFIEEYPAGHCDVWSNGMISFYYYDPDSSNGYNSIYLDGNGEKVELGCGVGVTCIKSYTGVYVSEDTTIDSTKEDTTPKEDVTPKEDTTDDSTKEESATDQEQSKSIQELSGSIQKLSESIQEQHVTSEKQTVTEQEQTAKTEKTIWNNIYFSGVIIGLAVIFIARIFGWKD